MRLRNTFILLFISFFLSSTSFASATAFRFSPRPNKAHLIKWRNWDIPALEEAARLDKLILLSLSAVWCHWCHVMDETTYSDDDIIDFINTQFIPIRVDSDMRPDIDSLYNQGGWPSTAILTPEGEIIDGGTYIPPEDMKMRLKRIIDLYASQKDDIRKRVEELRKTMVAREDSKPSSPDEIEIAMVTRLLEDNFDDSHGGFGVWQKFPNPDAIDFLLSEYFHTSPSVAKKGKGGLSDKIKAMITLTLDGMAEGEIYDSVEGGFFRYSTRPDWSSPHYEKMLFDNAGIIRNYADAFMVLTIKPYKKIIEQSVEYIHKNLMDNSMARFYGSQDADESYYKAQRRKGLTPPYIDKTTYADSTARMIRALVSTYTSTVDTDYLRTAEKTAEFIINDLYIPLDGVYHYYSDGKKRLNGVLQDNVLVASALLDLYNVTGNRRYLDIAQTIGEMIIQKFYDKGLRQFRPSLDTTLIKPVKPGMLQDYNTALVNFRAAILLSRLSYIEKNEQVKNKIDTVLASYKESYDRFMPAAPLYGTALRWHLKEPAEIIIIAEDKKARTFLAELNRIFIPEKTVLILSPVRDKEHIARIGYPSEKEAAYICEGKRCSRPITNADDLVPTVKRFLKQ